ncbi:hypothetical protein [Caulobacter endophyticus]|uniref:hypothetical protein n=1 Tax=Caulobacter endophyticus TaxID=2172652 RepID=UPI00241000FF|nr:hypothetical protein [Caulobacter endophyticus]MDG2528024.1 hypothetical protein [Caulobacter endophyticus]
MTAQEPRIIPPDPDALEAEAEDLMDSAVNADDPIVVAALRRMAIASRIAATMARAVEDSPGVPPSKP